MAIGSVANAAPATVLPWSLCSAFSRSEIYKVDENRYRDGTSQRLNQVTNSRKAWDNTRPLTVSKLATLEAFWIARRCVEPFYFYDVSETTAFAYDVTGASTTGRYTVRFEGPWEVNLRGGTLRGVVAIKLVEVA